MIKRYGLVIAVLVLVAAGYFSFPHKAAAAACPPPNQDFTETCESEDPPTGDETGTPPLGDTMEGTAGVSSDGNNGYTTKLFLFTFPGNAGQIYKIGLQMLRNDNPSPGVEFCVNNTSVWGNGLCYTAQNLDSGPNTNGNTWDILGGIDSLDYTYYSHLVVKLTVHQTFFNENNVITRWTMYRREFSDLKDTDLITPTISQGDSPQFAWTAEGTAVPVRKMFMDGPSGINGFWDEGDGVPKATGNWSPPMAFNTPGTYNFTLEVAGPARFGGEDKRTWDSQVEVMPLGGPPGPFSVLSINCFGWPNSKVEVNIGSSSTADTYDLERREGSGSYSVVVTGKTFAQLDSYTDDTVVNGNAYEYRVKAVNTYGSTYSSNTQSIFISAANCGGVGQNTLSVVKEGTGNGTVTSNPAGINCGGTCNANFTTGTSITLTAVADSGSNFVGWTGGCGGALSTCNLVLNSNTNVHAVFNNISGCAGYNAEFVNQTINGVTYNSTGIIALIAGTTVPVSITMRNPCGQVWLNGTGYALGSQNPQDNMTWGLNRIPIANNVFQFATETFNFNITIPAGGINNFQWRMLNPNFGIGWFGDFTPVITIVSNNPPNVWLDVPPATVPPAPPATVSGLVDIGGWAIDSVFAPEGAIGGLNILIDGVVVSTNSYGAVARADVCGFWPGRANCPFVGFDYFWDSTTVANGAHTITITVWDTTGLYAPQIFRPINVNNPLPVDAPTIHLSSPACGQISVDFDDNSNNETGFRIWRKPVNGGDPYNAGNSWTLLDTRAPNDNSTHTDTTPPLVANVRYYYVVEAYNAAHQSYSSEANWFNAVCAGNLTTTTKSLYQVEGSNYNSSTLIEDGDSVTWRIILRNIGENITVNYICDTPTPNFINLRDMTSGGHGSKAGNLLKNTARCSGATNYDLPVSGVKAKGSGDWTILFDSTFQSVGSVGVELCTNTAVINFTDAEGTKTQTIKAPAILCNKGATGTPDIHEVAP